MMQTALIWLICICYSQGFSLQSTCNPGEDICNHSCYDTTKFDCLENKICAKGERICQLGYSGAECYNTTSHHCVVGKHICLIGQNACGWECYYPEDQICFGNLVCNVGESHCAGKCYNMTLDGSGMVCSPDGKALCNVGYENCGYRCYDPKTGAKCYHYNGFNPTLCQSGEENCGFECYDPKTEKCFNDTKVCRSTREPCGDYNCYWPHNETCYPERQGYNAMSCPINLKPCRYDCYDADDAKYHCSKSEHGYEQLCPRGTELCGQECYTTSVDTKCVKGLVCKIHEEVCARKCYDPKSLGQNMGCHMKDMATGLLPVSSGTISEFEGFKCNPGYDMNQNGDCQRVYHVEMDESSGSKENVHDSNKDAPGSTSVLTSLHVHLYLLFWAIYIFILL